VITCDTFWGSHGCELPRGHDSEQDHPIHECSIPEWDEFDAGIGAKEVCSQAQYVDDEKIQTRFTTQEGGWTDWREIALDLFRNDKEKAR